MTEAEAKQKWCPILGLAGAVMKSTDGERKCIGSACMMWREQTVNESPDLMRGVQYVTYRYCGLAGKP